MNCCFSHFSPPHPTASEDALLVVAASVSKEGTQLQGPHPTPPHPTPPHPTPSHPTASGDDAMLSVAARVVRTVLFPPTPPHLTWRRCHAECSSTDLGCKVTRILVSESHRFWSRNHPCLGAESSFFGCGIVCFWLRKRLFWLRKRI